jgi:hypothetical protein
MSQNCIKELLKGGTCGATARLDTKDGMYCRTHDPNRLAQRELDEELAKLRGQVTDEARLLRNVVGRINFLRDELRHPEVLEQAVTESKRPDFDPARVQALTDLAKEIRLSDGARKQAALDDGTLSNYSMGRFPSKHTRSRVLEFDDP